METNSFHIQALGRNSEETASPCSAGNPVPTAWLDCSGVKLKGKCKGAIWFPCANRISEKQYHTGNKLTRARQGLKFTDLC